jgi:lysozyme family protein
MMAEFEFAFTYVLENEGGYCVDDGGPTKWGIVRADLAAFRGVPIDQITAQDIKNLSADDASKIYQKQYWTPMRLMAIEDTGVATAIFDIGVNRGIEVGAKYAQKAANLLGHPLYVDGVIGPQTLQAINACVASDFIRYIEAMDVAGYLAILRAHPEDKIYERGWMARAKRLLTLI